MVSDKQVKRLSNTFDNIKSKLDDVSKKVSDMSLEEKEFELINEALLVKPISELSDNIIDVETLSNILHNFIFIEKFDLKRILQLEMMSSIVDESLVTDVIISQETNSNIKSWLHYTVIPFIYLNKKKLDINQKITGYSDEIAKERMYGDVLEHKHKSNDYWHPTTRVHAPNLYPKNVLPKGHVLQKFKSGKDLPQINIVLKGEDKSTKTDKSFKYKYIKLIENSVANLHVVENILYFDLNKLVEKLYHYIIKLGYSLDEVLNKSLIDDIINKCVKYEDMPSSDYSLDLKNNVYTLLVKRIVPDIYVNLSDIESSDIKSSTDKEDSRMFEKTFGVSTSTKAKDEIITKDEIKSCIYPFDLNWMSKEDSDYIDIIRLIDILYDFANDHQYINYSDIMYVFNTKYFGGSEKLLSMIPDESKNKIKKWLQRIVIPCINSVIEINIKDRAKDFPQLKKLDYTIDMNSKLYKRMDKIVRDLYDSFYDEKLLCLYYTYYVLNLKGNSDFNFEFRELENKLYRDFYNYGIFAVLGEMGHFVDMFYVKVNNTINSLENFITFSPFDSNKRVMFRKGADEFISNVSKCVGVDKKSIYRILQIYEIGKGVSHNIDNYKESSIIRDIKFLYLIEKYFGYFTRPDFIFKLANKVFIKKGGCCWSSRYGGEKWKSISKTMLARKNMVSKTVFIDTCWSLQHNTELFINKIFNVKLDIGVIRRYLTDIKNGKFDRVYECAIKHNTKLDRFVYKNLIYPGFKGKKRRKQYVDIRNFSLESKIGLYKELDSSLDHELSFDNVIINEDEQAEIILDVFQTIFITDLKSISDYLFTKVRIEVEKRKEYK